MNNFNNRKKVLFYSISLILLTIVCITLYHLLQKQEQPNFSLSYQTISGYHYISLISSTHLENDTQLIINHTPYPLYSIKKPANHLEDYHYTSKVPGNINISQRYIQNNNLKYGSGYSCNQKDSSCSPPVFSNALLIKYPFPERFLGGIGYQIIIDRFRNGDTKNDIPRNSEGKRTLGESKILETIVPREQDRYRFTDNEQAIINSINPNQNQEVKSLEAQILRNRTYGGDFSGIIEKIPYLKDLHVGFVYLNTPFIGSSPIGYDTRDYHHIEPKYGPISNTIESGEWTTADKSFITLINTLTATGIHTIIDISLFYSNLHTKYIEDIARQGETSPYFDRFDIYDTTDTPSTGQYSVTQNIAACPFSNYFDTIQYPKAKNLYFYSRADICGTGPKFKNINNNYHPKLNAELFQALDKWILPNKELNYGGVDGLRLDVFGDLPEGFVAELYKKYKQQRSDFIFVAEDRRGRNQYGQKQFSFDSKTNYQFRSLVQGIFFPGRGSLLLSDIDTFISKSQRNNLKRTILSWRNIVSSHDTNRIWSLFHPENQSSSNILQLGRDHDHLTRPQNGGNVNTSLPNFEDNMHTIKAILGLKLIYPGSMMIYYGDEVGMRGPDDPSNRQPMLRDDIEYQKQSLCLYDKIHYCKPMIQSGYALSIQTGILELYQSITALKSENTTLKYGSFSINHLGSQDDEDIIAFERNFGDDQVIYIYNRGNSTTTLPISLYYKNSDYHDILNNQVYHSNELGSSSISIPTKQAVLLMKSKN